MIPIPSTQCFGKQRHRSLGKAQAAIRSLLKRGLETPETVEAYFCPWCHGYHVGHRRRASFKRDHLGVLPEEVKGA